MKENSIFLFLVLAFLGGCGGVQQWQEEVMQPDGTVLVIERSHVLDSRLNRELSAFNAPPDANSYVISIPLRNGGRAKWEADHKDMIPLALSVSGDAIQILASPFNCSAYARFGQPVPPFLIFRYDSGHWIRTSIDDFPAAITEANLLISTSTGRAVEEIEKGVVTAKAIKRIWSSGRFIDKALTNICGPTAYMISRRVGIAKNK